MGASVPLDGPLDAGCPDTGFVAASQGPACPRHGPALPLHGAQRSSWGPGHLGGQGLRGRRRATQGTHLHGNQTHWLLEEPGKKEGDFKNAHTLHFWERTPRKRFSEGRQDAGTTTVGVVGDDPQAGSECDAEKE